MPSWSSAIVGSFRQQVGAVERAHKRAATNVMRRSAVSLKNAIRKEVKGAGLGEGVANAVRDAVYPSRGIATDPASSVFSKAVYKRPGGLVDLLTVFREGAVIVAKTGEFLLIGGRKFKNFRQQWATLTNAAQRRGGYKLLRGTKQIAFARQVKILPRLKGMDAAYQRVQATVQDKYAKEYEAQIAREGAKL